MDAGYVLAFFPAVFGGAAVAVLAVADRLSGRGRLLRAARRAPLSHPIDITDGATIKIAGTVRLAETALTAPLSGRRCGCYEAELARSGGAETSFDRERIWYERTMGGFVVEGGGVRAWIGGGPKTEMQVQARELGGAADRDAIGAILQREGARCRIEHLDALEWALVEGATVIIYGEARWMHDPEPDERSERGYRNAPRRLVITALAILEP